MGDDFEPLKDPNSLMSLSDVGEAICFAWEIGCKVVRAVFILISFFTNHW